MISSKQRAFLRGIANKIDATVQVGKGGISENMISLVNDLLEKNELVKVHVLENSLSDTKDVCHELSEAVRAEEVQVIGSKFVLYKESRENKKIDLKNLTLKVAEKKPQKQVKPLYKAKEAARKERKRKEEKRLKTKKFFASKYRETR